jgi:HYDIN/CFA65/VesB-like, Ig-like domain
VRRRHLALLALLLTVGCGGEGAGLVATPTQIQFGEIVLGDRAVRTVELRNAGTKAVLVTAVKPNCVCFSVGPYQHSLQPGESTQLSVTLDSALVPAEPLRGKTLTVVSDAPVGG